MSDLPIANQDAIMKAIYGSSAGVSSDGVAYYGDTNGVSFDQYGYSNTVGSGYPTSYEVYKTNTRNTQIMYILVGILGLAIIYYAVK